MKLRSRRRRTSVALALAIALILLGYFARSQTGTTRRSGKEAPAGVYVVEHVYDGDSLRLENSAEVRIVGIDTPEKGHDMSDEARRFAKKLLEGRDVHLVPAAEPKDRHGRVLAYLYFKRDGRQLLVNSEMVRLGYAYAWPYKPNTTHAEEIMTAQKEAQAARRGLWAHAPAKCDCYVVETGPKFSLTHRPDCPKLRNSKRRKMRFEKRLDAVNCNKGAPPCRTCKP